MSSTAKAGSLLATVLPPTDSVPVRTDVTASHNAPTDTVGTPVASAVVAATTASPVVRGAWNYSRSKVEVAIAIRNAHGTMDEKVLQSHFMLGYVAQRISPEGSQLTKAALSAAYAVSKAADHKAKSLKDGQRHRTDDEQKAWDGARTAWVRALIDAGVKEKKAKTIAPELDPSKVDAEPVKEGDAPRAEPKREKSADPMADAKAAAPVAETMDDANDHCELQIRSLLAFSLKNKRTMHPAIAAALTECSAKIAEALKNHALTK